MSDQEELTKVVVDLPNHWATGGESMWAKPLGNDQYEIRNTPFHAYGLNYLDVVRAVSPSPDLKPQISEVVRTSGHQTLRVFFTSDSLSKEERLELLKRLSPFQASLECATDNHFAIDIEPDGNYGAVCDQLYAWENEGILSYETCEARVSGSLDDSPQEDE